MRSVAVLAAYSQVPDQFRDELAEVGVDGRRPRPHGLVLGRGVGAAARRSSPARSPSRGRRHWPEMGSRYDAPGAAAATAAGPPEEQTSLDLWKALDEGRDPTARPATE